MNQIKNFLKEEDGMGVVEVVLILAIIVGIAIIFKDRITEFVAKILDSIIGEGDSLGTDSIKDDMESNMNN